MCYMRSLLYFLIVFFIAAETYAGEVQLYTQLKKVEAATQVGVNAIELKKLLYPAAALVNDLGLTEVKVRSRIKNPTSGDWLFLAYSLYVSSSNLLKHGYEYNDPIQKTWATASNCLVNAKKLGLKP